MGNSSAERFNQTLLRMLETLTDEQKSEWKTFIAPLVLAYNSIRNDATGFSPHYLINGWHPRFPVDAYPGVGTPENPTVDRNTKSILTLSAAVQLKRRLARIRLQRDIIRSEQASRQKQRELQQAGPRNKIGVCRYCPSRESISLPIVGTDMLMLF